MTFSLTILGCSSATPTLYRHPSAQILNVSERLFLIDCGEGAQMQMRNYSIRFQRINHIFISHLHGDHYLGLMGLLFTFHLLGRTNPVHLYAHTDLEKIIDLQLSASQAHLNFPLIFHPLTNESRELIFEDEIMTVHSFPLQHRIPTVGFIIKEKLQPRKFKKDILLKEDIPYASIEKIKMGENFTTADGRLLKNAELTITPPRPRSYAYCSDTGFDESLIPIIQGVDLLYHEATFMQEKAKNAVEKLHSTAIDAATIALKANVKQLVIGHYSARYDDLQPLLDEARTVFENTSLAEEGKVFEVPRT